MIVRKRKAGQRRRRRFTLNGLAIQVSAFALSFTLVALLVVSGSQAAFVEENEIVTEYVPIGTPEPTAGAPRRPGPARPVEVPAPPPSEPATVLEIVDEPDVEVVAEPDVEVALTDSAAGTALFGSETLVPGMGVERCIEVTYEGTADPDSVLLYAAPTAGDLTPYLDLTISIGLATTGSSSACTGFAPSATLFSGTLAQFATVHSSYATGRATWDPDDQERTRAFRFRVSVQDVPAAAGRSTSFGFTWRTEAS